MVAITKNYYRCPNCRKVNKMIKEPSVKMIDARSLRLKGFSFKEIGKELGISESCARDHNMNYIKRRSRS